MMRAVKIMMVGVMAMALGGGVFDAGAGVSNILDMPRSPKSNPARTEIRSALPVQRVSTLTCDENALCSTLTGTFQYVYGQVGLYYFNTVWNRNAFVRMYVSPAVSEGGQYKVPKWDGKGYFMIINPDKPPLWIQPLFVDDDPETCTGCKEFMSSAVLYKMQGVDYSTWTYKAALAYIYLSVDACNQVKDYWLNVYDISDKLAQEGVKLNIGDSIQMTYVEDDSDDSPEWEKLSIENPTEVAQKPKIVYEGYIPLRDFPCTHCGIDLASTDIHFRVQGWTSETAETPSWSELKLLGRLGDHVSPEYPYKPITYTSQAAVRKISEINPAAVQQSSDAGAGGWNIYDMPRSPRAMRASVNKLRSVLPVRSDVPLTCGENAFCGTLAGTFPYVYGQVGLYFFSPEWNRYAFIRLYVNPAAISDCQYKIPKWDGKGYFIKISTDSPPLWIQPMFLEDDPETCAGCREFMSSAMLYKKQGVDYSTWPYKAALAYIYFTVDANNQVKLDENQKPIYWLEVYDQNDELAQQEVKLNIGDSIQMTYVEDDSDDSPEWSKISVENPTAVAQDPEIVYAGYIPKRDIPCTNCGIDIAQTDIYFRLQGWASETATTPSWSGIKPLGRLSDNVCSEFPYLTTANPTLADVIEGMKIAAAIKPLHFCFRDINGNIRFGLEELIYMLQKIAAVR